jgi:LacI family transcriptional regulator
LKAAETLKYRPNLLVRGIQTGKTSVIGVMAPPFDTFWADILYGIHDALAAFDYVPMMVWTSHKARHKRPATLPASPDHELKQVHRLLDRRIDGVILWPPFAAHYSNHVHEFSSRDLPIVTIDYEMPPEFNADCVLSDEDAGTKAVAKHLYDLGHRRFAHLSGLLNASWAINRKAGFERALGAYPDTSCVSIEAILEDDSRNMEPPRDLLRHPSRPTAIFAATDLLAKKLYTAAEELKLRIPQDISIVGYADDDFSAQMRTPLTTVRQDGYGIGSRAAQILLDRLSGKIRDTARITEHLPVELVVRESTAAASTNRA